MDDVGWRWDPTLYRGSAAYYALGRVAYPRALTDAIVAAIGADGTGRLLDLGCGPGSLTLPLAASFAEVVGLDADPDMLTEAARGAAAAGITNATWVCSRAEELDLHLGPFDVVTLAQSFHWMDRAAVAALLHAVLAPCGAVVHVHATTHEGVDTAAALPHARPPRAEIAALIEGYLGSRRRAGQGTLPQAVAPEPEVGRVEDGIYRAVGFADRTRIEIEGPVVTRTADEVVASVFSLSSAAPHLFGNRVGDFETDLRTIVRTAGPDGVFSEQLREIAVDIWRS